MIDVSIVIACYNEEGHLEESVRLIDVSMGLTKLSYELVFVDDGSRDRTREIIERLVKQSPDTRRRILNKHNLGRGGTVTRGLKRSRGTYAGFIDIDLEVGAHYIPHCIASLINGASVVTALRIYKLDFRGIIRHILSRGYSLLVRKLLHLPFCDTETGFKFFNREKIIPILSQMKDNGWFWDTEIMARSLKNRLTIVELPCLFIRRHDKKSSVHLFRDSVRYFYSLLKYRNELKV